VSAIASHAAELPLIQRRDNEDQGDVVDTGDPLLWLLNVRANSHENGSQFRQRCVAQGLVSRDGVYIEYFAGRQRSARRFGDLSRRSG